MRNSQSSQQRKAASRAKPAKPQREASSAAKGATPHLYDFTVSFFEEFGAKVAPFDRRTKHGPLRISLPPDLAEHFGGETLGLAFQSVEEGSGHQLVAHGSRAFDRMLGLLKRHSALTVRRLPVKHTGSEALLSAVRPRNASIANLRLQEQQDPLYAFHWRLTYRADDKREELHSVVLDAKGTPVSLGAADGLPSLDALLADSSAVVFDAPPGDGETEASVLAQPLAPAAAESGVRLPPLTHLVRLAERARKFAVYHADLRCVAHEADILPRLYKVLDRLTNYYAQQIEEVSDAHDPSGDRRTALEGDLERKIDEEVENHRLRVHVELCGYAILYIPVATAEMMLSDGRREAPVRVRLDRYSGVLHRPTCFACGMETESLALDRNGHIHCDGCLRQCETCQEILCATCGVEPCPACGRENCENCGRSCWACGQRACVDHVSRCPVCGDEVCHDCQEACAECGVRQCRSHLRADAVLEEDGSSRLVCGTCAVRCPGCNQHSARLGTCSLSGQRFCANCLVKCSECGRVVGPGFYALTADRRLPVCKACVVICPSCGEVSEQTSNCHACGSECCSTCSRGCAVCGERFCAEHWSLVDGCGHVLCVDHAGVCAIGGEAVCPTCSEPCAICERPVCTHHQMPCAWCGRVYCSQCIGVESGLCRTCTTLLTRRATVNMGNEAVASHPDVRALLPKYNWRRAANRAVTVYVGLSLSGNVLVVARSMPNGKLMVVTRKLSLQDLYRGAFKW